MYSDNGEMLRYFLPRWLEWLSEENAAFDELRSWNLWWLGCRLASAKWHLWPADEVAVLRDLFAVWTREEIAEHGGAPPHSWPRQATDLGEEGERMGLVGFSVYSDLLEFLTDIGEGNSYLELWLDTNLPFFARWLWTENWGDSKFKALRPWITSSRVEDELEAAFFADPDGPNAELFSRSVELVRSLRAL